MSSKSWRERFDEIGFGNQARIVGAKRVEVKAFIANEIEKANQEAREEFAEKIKRRFQFSKNATAKISVRGIEEDVKNVVNDLLAEYRKEKK